MAPVNQWLNLASFQGRIKLPDNFDVSVFNTTLIDLQEDGLPALLGADRLAALVSWLGRHPYGVTGADPTVPITDPMANLYVRVVPYLVYMCYAEYVLAGDVQATDTGLVTKDRDQYSSQGLTDTARMQLYRTYRDKANVRAAQIAEYVASLQINASCTPAVYTPELRISSSRGRTVSIADRL